MSDPQQPRDDDGVPSLPGPPPPLPDLAAVSASIEPPAVAPAPPAMPAASAAAGASSGPVVPTPATPAAPAVPGSAAAAPVIDAAAVPSTVHTIDSSASDAAAVPAVTRVPGAADTAGYGRLPSAPVATTLRGPVEGETEDWQPEELPRRRPIAGPWALALAIIALAGSFFVGWMLPLGLVAIVVGVVALRRPVESRTIAVWAIVLGAVSVLYSAGWLLWAATQLGLLG